MYWNRNPEPKVDSLVQADRQPTSFGAILLVASLVNCVFSGTTVQAAPVVTAVVNAATLRAGSLAPGTLISVFGTGFSTAVFPASSAPPPMTLGGVSVLLNGELIPLLFVSQNQINAQLPYRITPGSATLTVRDADANAVSFAIFTTDSSPGIFTRTANGQGEAIATRADSSSVVAAEYANAGETVILYCTGLGEVNALSPVGTPAPSSRLPGATRKVEVLMDGQSATVVYAGLMPGSAGLYQIHFVVPDRVAGDVSTSIRVGMVTSNEATIHVGLGFEPHPPTGIPPGGRHGERLRGPGTEVAVSNYSDHITSSFAGAFFGTTGTTESSLDWVVADGNLLRIRQDGTLSRLRVYVSDNAALSAAYLVIWRNQSGRQFNRVGIQQVTLSGGLNSVILGAGISVLTGDYVGMRAEYTVPHAATISTFGCAIANGPEYDTRANLYYNLSQASPSSLDIGTMAVRQNCTPAIEVWENAAPGVLAIGDSIFARYDSYIDPFIHVSDLDQTFHNVGRTVANSLGLTYMDMSMSGVLADQLANRFYDAAIRESDATTWIVMEGGINNISAGHTTARIVDAWTSMLSAGRAAGRRMIAVLILPWTGGTNLQNQQRDAANAQITKVASSYGVAVVDAAPTVGKVRVGGDPGNLWDIQGAYDSGDGLHYNSNGSAAIAGVIAAAIAHRNAR